MEGDTDRTTFDVNVHFVVLDKYETEKECNNDMWMAYDKCPDLEIMPEWISEGQCLEIKPTKKDVFIMEDFAGRAFNYLLRFNCTITGPRCLLSCFVSGEPIPDGSSPVFNTAMRNIIVSASGFSGSVKNDIQKKVEYMGGKFSKQLRVSVTHLVTDTVISAKYERAVELNIKIMTLDWINSVWDTNLTETVPATDSIFDKYKCPVFYNLVVTSTNLNKKQKEDIKRLITRHGGEFMGILDGTKVKLLITVETNSLSEKLKYAMQNDIPCLKAEWVHDSIESGYSLPFIKYLIKSTQACSTPEKHEALEPFNLTSISVIPGDNHNAYVDETLASATTMSSTVMSSTLMENVPAVSRASYIAVVERLNLAEAKKAGPFLDGCNIYLTGFTSNYRDKLNRILNVGSATRLDEISDALTHVIVGDPIKAEQDLRTIKSKGLHPCLLKIEWLEECIKIQAPALEDNFIFDAKVSSQKSAPEPPSPLSKKNLQLLQRPKIPAVPLFEETVPKRPVSKEHSDIVEQYLQKSSSKPDNSLREILKLPNNDNLKNTINASKEQTFAERWNESVRRQTENTLNMDQRDDSAIPISQESCISQKIFLGSVFVVSGFDGDDYTQVSTQIRGLGGKVVGESYSGIPNFGVVPITGATLKQPVTEIVTDLFIEDCIDNERVVEIAYYHRPLQVANNTKPLENCVIGMSTYSGAERSYLSQLSEILGARYQDTFARKTNPQKKTFSSTHLICPKPQGDKYSAAVKWKLPAVNAEWLLRCASDMKLVDETPFLIGETMAPERPDATLTNDSSIMKPPPDPTPKRLFFNSEEFGEGTSETPVINKRIKGLLNQKTPNSPFHISTPDTPYGQVFKDNPSPATRKGWKKWIDHLTELPVDEPPPKRRKSTPFSEVKKQAWDWVTGRSNEQDGEDNKDTPQERDANSSGVEPVATHIVTNRRLSFSDDSSPKKPRENPEINKQMDQLEELLQKASSTPEARQSLSAEHANPYHLELNQPPGRCLIKDSQPDSVGWEDPIKRVPPPQRQSTIGEEAEVEDLTNEAEEEESELEEVQKPKFMFSGIKDKSAAEQFIKEHGGEVSTESSFDPTATHLLCLKPARNEKILSSIAAGKWVLHYLYIEACIEENQFLNEEEYELGNPKSKGVIPDPSSENEKIIMTAAHRWRLKLLEEPGGAFQDMVALLIVQKEKKEQFERLINAGGGTVVEARPPYDQSPKGRKITHCFIQLKNIDQQVDWAMMAGKGIMCYPPQYLNDHLMAETPPNPRDLVLPEFKKYLALMPK